MASKRGEMREASRVDLPVPVHQRDRAELVHHDQDDRGPGTRLRRAYRRFVLEDEARDVRAAEKEREKHDRRRSQQGEEGLNVAGPAVENGGTKAEEPRGKQQESRRPVEPLQHLESDHSRQDGDEHEVQRQREEPVDEARAELDEHEQRRRQKRDGEREEHDLRAR